MNDRAARLHLAARMAHIAPFEVMEIQTLARELESAGPRRDPPRDRRAGLPHAGARWSRPRSARSTRSRCSTPRPSGSRRCARRSRASTATATGSTWPRAHRRDRGLERGAAARLRRAARCGRRGAARRPGLSLQPPFRARPGRRAAPRARRGGHALPAHAGLARGAWTPRTRIAMVATPSNPTGTMVPPGEVAALAALARETGRHAPRRRDLPRPHLRRRRRAPRWRPARTSSSSTASRSISR